MTTYWKSRLLRLWTDEGGWITAALAGAGLLGKVFSGQAKGAAEGRKTQADLQAEQDRIRTSQYGTAQNAQMQAGGLDLQRKGFEEAARGGRAKQATLADMLMSFKPASVSIPGVQNAQVSGGMQIGEGAKAALGNLYKQALLKQLEGDTFEGGEILKQPGVTPIPKASGWEKFAGILGNIGSIAGAAGQAGQMFSGGAPSVPGIPMAQGMPSSMPGAQMNGLSIPDAPDAPLADIIARINAITSRSDVEGRR